MDNSEQVTDLHTRMQDCDRILARMQEMLQGFQTDLGGISEEIKHLQDESLSMSVRLKNRRLAEEKLHIFLENTSITPDLAAAISNGVVNEAYLEAIIDLSSKLQFMNQSSPPKDGSSLDMPPSETYAGKTLLPDLERLKARSISKIREYFTQQFNAIRKAKTNVQMLQQTALVKYSPLFQFLLQESPLAAEDLRLLSNSLILDYHYFLPMLI